MPSVALIPACALVAGVGAGISIAQPLPYVAAPLVVVWAVAVAGWRAKRDLVAIASVTLGYALAGMALGGQAAAGALSPSIRTVLDREVGGFALTAPGPPAPHEPLTIRAELEEDAVVRQGSTADVRDDVISVRTRVESMVIRGERRPVRGGVRLSIAGDAARARAREWRAGTIIEAPVTFRRPVRYLNDGVPDVERDLALDGIALNASVKSGLLVDVVRGGSLFDEAAAAARALVRRNVARFVGTRDAIAGGIVTAILIGDRTGLPDDVRARLQAAGTYHVIAISGGNIAILAALIAGVLVVAGVSGRMAAVAILTGVTAYATVVDAGPSVWRATIMAVAYLAARAIDHRSPPWNAIAVSAALIASVAPLDIRAAGFALTFGATIAIVEAGRRVHTAAGERSRVWSWLLTSVVASAAAEVVLLPITAAAFSRVTFAGIVLNLVAVPLMTVVQIAGLVVTASAAVEGMASPAGALAAAAATALVESARLVDVMPWLALRVPAPSPVVMVVYYVALGTALWVPRLHVRVAASAAVLACALTILAGIAPRVRWHHTPGMLTLTMFDVGQGEAILLRTPGGQSLMIDSGGAAFDGAAFDIGSRVVTPAVWARGVRRLDALAITHADPDHIGGAAPALRELRPRALWQGVAVPRHAPEQALLALARELDIAIATRRAGQSVTLDGVELRVLHPPAPDWERQRVRNDDSLVLEVRHGDVAILLAGDIGREVEREIAPRLTPARIRILKVAHHGSRTSTSEELLRTWQPQIALISCGRGNRFGHPATEVVRRLEAAGARIYRTDRDGQVTIISDGNTVEARTYLHSQTR